MPSQKNIDKVSDLKTSLSEAKSIVLADYKGLNVEQMTKLRQQIKEAGGEITIIKNTLLKIGLKDNKYDLSQAADVLTGPTAILFCFKDEIAPIKTLYEYAKENDLPKIKIGFLDKDFLSEDKVIALAKLPSLEVLQARLVGTLNSPTSNFVHVLKANLQGFLSILKQISKQKN
ncbi:50S ribosomal protein L10 [Patescibacteria group bacterium]